MTQAKTDKREFHILMLEDNALDAEMVSTLLTQAQIDYQLMRVETEAAFRSTLETQSFDVILADYSLPSFDGLSAIEIAREICPNVPCILVSGILGEEKAIDALRSGATDYVLKQRIERLVPAVKRALKDRQEQLALQQARRDREESQQRFQTLMETMADPLAVIAVKREQGIVQDFTVRHLNESACDYLSIDLSEAMGQSLHRVIPALKTAEVPGTDLIFLDRLYGVLETGVLLSEEIFIKGEQSSIQQVVLDVRVARLSEEIIVLTWRDVTERYQMLGQLEQLLAEAETARNQAEQANRFKDTFLATVTHELRSPLAVIKGWLNIVERRPKLENALPKMVDVIGRNTFLLEHLIEDLLDVSRISEGKMAFNPEVISFDRLGQTLADTIEAINPIASQKGIDISFQASLPATPELSLALEEASAEESRAGDMAIDTTLDTAVRSTDRREETLSHYIMGDTVRLQQVIRNLLSNAIKFTPEGGRVEVVATGGAEAIAIQVKDSGRGIDAAELPHLFERFWQANSSKQGQGTKGLGIGLSIVRYLVELHHGSIAVDSEGKGKGSTFTIEIPTLSRKPVPIPAEGAEMGDWLDGSRTIDPASLEAVDTALLKGTRVMIVEDYSDALEMYKLMLEAYGAEVEGTESADTAIDLFKQFKPHVLISDISLPNTDGYMLMRQIRALSDREGGNVMAIALTAFSEKQYRTKALLAGYQLHIAKPIGLHEIAKVVADLAASDSAQ